jgi:hypothetical protein
MTVRIRWIFINITVKNRQTLKYINVREIINRYLKNSIYIK